MGATAVANPQNPAAVGGYRLYDILWLLLLLIGVFILVDRSAVATDPDLWWHLRAGDWISDHHTVPWRDSFGRYTYGEPWFDYSWLFDWMVGLLYRFGGLIAIFALTRALIAGCVLALFDIVSQYVSQGYALALSFLYLIALFQLETPRPWLFSILLFTLELRFLLKAQQDNRPWLLVWLVPLFGIWANLHIQFVYGLGVLGLFSLVNSLPKRWPTSEQTSFAKEWWWFGFALSTVSTLVNPYGWRIYQVVWSYAVDQPGLRTIQEMRPFSLEAVSDWSAIILLILAVGAIGWSRRLDALSCSLLLVGCWFGFHVGRDIWFLAITSAVAAARALREHGHPNPLRWRQILPVVLITACIYAAEIEWGSVSATELEHATKQAFPVGASSFIADKNLPEPLFNTFDWGGYLIWRLPKMLVSIDGRANLYGSQGIASFMDTLNGHEQWRNDPKFQNAKTVLLPPQVAMASLLRQDSGFKKVYEDPVAVIFVRSN